MRKIKSHAKLFVWYTVAVATTYFHLHYEYAKWRDSKITTEYEHEQSPK